MALAIGPCAIVVEGYPHDVQIPVICNIVIYLLVAGTIADCIGPFTSLGNELEFKSVTVMPHDDACSPGVSIARWSHSED
jgi:hypothetical protein